jgi:hypothetical protein
VKLALWIAAVLVALLAGPLGWLAIAWLASAWLGTPLYRLQSADSVQGDTVQGAPSNEAASAGQCDRAAKHTYRGVHTSTIHAERVQS